MTPLWFKITILTALALCGVVFAYGLIRLIRLFFIDLRREDQSQQIELLRTNLKARNEEIRRLQAQVMELQQRGKR